jgi:hypothetical protein
VVVAEVVVTEEVVAERAQVLPPIRCGWSTTRTEE